MLGVYELTYRDGRTEKHWGHDGYFYLLGPDEIYWMRAEPAWCRDCQEITLCEEIPNIEEVTNLIKEVENPDSAWHRKQPKPLDPAKVHSWRSLLLKQLRFATARRLPPKCFQRGNRNIVAFKLYEWSTHPFTGEEVLIKMVGIGSTNLARRYFGIDGEELQLSDAEKK